MNNKITNDSIKKSKDKNLNNNPDNNSKSDNKSKDNSAVSRKQIIIRTSLIGILTNILLAGFKAVIGLFTNSIAIILDAVNNLSDVLSSAVTIIGAKLASKNPDKKHPLGHGRIEYISSLVVAAIILYAGFTSIIESVKKIFNPVDVSYNTVSIVIISVAIIVKLVLGTYVKKQGKKANSSALAASGSDALFDAILSSSVLASAIIYLKFNISLEAYVGVIISIFIIRAGLEMTKETTDDIIGHRSDPKISKKIKGILNEEPEVKGAYDLALFNYGPGKYYGSVHLELPDVMTVDDVDKLTRRVEQKVYNETGVILTGVGVYSYNTKNEKVNVIRNKIQKTVLSHDWALQLHGFYLDLSEKTIRFDVVVSFDIDHDTACEVLYKEIQNLYPDYSVMIVPDIDITD